MDNWACEEIMVVVVAFFIIVLPTIASAVLLYHSIREDFKLYRQGKKS